jgi:uncharacterized protein YutE (UPF0331/DUF86 family)
MINDIVEDKQFKHLAKMYRNEREVLYRYDIDLPNFKFKTGKFRFIAIEYSWETNSEYVIRDYKPCIDFWTKRCTNPKSIISQLSSALRTRQVVIHKIKDLTDEQIQNMINDNINALSYLNAYIGEQNLIRAINKSC